MSDSIAAFGTLLERSTAVEAYLATGVIGDNNAILWTAVVEGTGGNSITVTLSNPGGTGALVIAVAGNDITVTLARTAGVITSTAAQVIAAVKASESADALVEVQNNSTSTGVGLMVAAVQTALANGSNSTSWGTVAEVTGIGGIALRLQTVPVTNHSSPSGWAEHLPCVIGYGPVAFDLNSLPTDTSQNHIHGLKKDLRRKTLRNFRLTFPDTTTLEFSALVSDYSESGPVEGKLAANCSLQISGVDDWTEAV